MDLPASFFRSLQSLASLGTFAASLDPALLCPAVPRLLEYAESLCVTRDKRWSLGQRPEKSECWTYTPLFSSSREGNLYPLYHGSSESSSLPSCPCSQRFLRVHAAGARLCSETGETEVSPLGSPLKSWKLKHSPDGARSWGFSSTHSALSQREAVWWASAANHHLCSQWPPADAISRQHLE